MPLETLTADHATFRAGPWRARTDMAYLVPMTPAYTLTERALEQIRTQLQARGFTQIVTAAVAPPERAALRRAGFTDRERLHLLRHDLDELPRRRRRRDPRIERGTRADRGAVLDLDARTFDEFWRLDPDGLTDAMDATPVSRLRVVRDGSLIAYSVIGRAGTQGFLQRLAVEPERQGAGLGSALVYDGLRWMRRRGATVAWVNTQENNERALGLYRRLGFSAADHDLTVLGRSVE